MNADHQLMTAFAADGSETAFQALVNRHVDLVYATALRQLGDPGIAEEVTQNVFIVLARKAPRLAGIETLAGWLHRTTILESKRRIRTELRRRRREEKAAELAALQHEGDPALQALVPLVDEGLLNLRDSDRLALILRYLEERSLREVAGVLGVDEDAARKRVARALERLSAFFRRRGFAVPAGAGAAGILAGSTQAAPALVAVSAVQAGLAAGSAATGMNLIWLHLMALTKTQTVLLCATLVAVPLVWQKRAEANIARQQAGMAAQLAASAHQADQLEAEIQRVQDSALRSEAETIRAENRLRALRDQRDGKAPRPAYAWDDNADKLRFPKKFLEQLPVSATVNKRGQLSDRIKEALQMTDSEVDRAQRAIDRFLADYHTAQADGLRLVPPTDKELNGYPAEDVRVFEVPAVQEKLPELRAALFSELEATLGGERFALFEKALQDWMPVNDQDHGINSGMAVLPFDHRERFYRPKPGEQWLPWGISAPRTYMQGGMDAADIPGTFRKYLQDWITIAQGPGPAQ